MRWVPEPTVKQSVRHQEVAELVVGLRRCGAREQNERDAEECDRSHDRDAEGGVVRNSFDGASHQETAGDGTLPF